jgi:hypothetical protein
MATSKEDRTLIEDFQVLTLADLPGFPNLAGLFLVLLTPSNLPNGENLASIFSINLTSN